MEVPPNEVTSEIQKVIAAVAQAIEQAQEAFGRGDENSGLSLLNTQANDILRMAVLTDDEDIRKELVLLYEAVQRF